MRIIYWTIAILVFLILGFFITTAVYVDKYLEEYVGKILREESVNIRGKRYRLKATSIKTDILQGNIELEDVEISPSSLISDTLMEPAIAFLNAQSFRIEGMDLSVYYFDGIISIDKILIKGPTMRAFFRYPDSIDLPAPSLKNIKIRAPEIMVDSIIISKGNGRLYEIKGSDTIKFFSIEEYYSKFADFHVDSFSPENLYPFDFDFGQATGKGLSINMSSYQDLRVEEIKWSTLDSVMRLNSIEVKPRIGPEDFASKLLKPQEWFSIAIEKMDLSPFDPKDYLVNREFKLSSINLIGSETAIYRDNSSSAEDQKNLLPRTILANIPWKTSVELVSFSNGKISYFEKYDESNPPLEIDFYDVNFSAGPLSSGQVRGYTWDIEATISGEIPFQTRVFFGGTDEAEVFEATGKLEAIECKKLNGLTQLLAPVKFNSGQISNLEFKFTGSQENTRGMLNMTFRDIEISSTVENGNPIRSKELLSMVRSSNFKSNSENGSSGKINYDRDPKKTFYNYFWRSVEDGILSCLEE